ncbi:phage tail protein [Escherichia coli]|uniref:phage tail protein n=1 Tax=Escherichia coli TaxID=562 RepID=UPI001659C631|nr:phage tail protein [Escherichia coli]MBC9167297.1 phage tail protein [Escherichia coli]
MATKYFALLTNIGAAKLANATALGAQVEITKMAVGDGNGALPTPNPAQTALTHELRRAQLNMLTIDPVNTNQIIAEQVIPEDVGGWWIREIGLFDKDGDMIAVANCAETYKPQLQEGSGRVQVIRVILIVSSTEAVTLKIDPSVVLATRKYVDDAVIEVKAYADDVMKKHVAAANPHKQYPLIANALKEMVDDGLVNQVLQNLRLGAGAPAIGIPFFWPSSAMPNTVMAEWNDMVFLKFNGATFSASAYPKLALVIPSLTLVDARGEFPRIWDDGRGVDSGRALLSAQGDTLQNITGSISDAYVKGGANSVGALSTGGVNNGQPSGGSSVGYNGLFFDASKSARTSTETRPRNIAFNFLVRAK